MRRYKYIPFSQLRIQYRRGREIAECLKTIAVISPMVVAVVLWMMF
ncbi:MAG: hypothetical protein RR593_07055 [Hungatella sp.]